MLDVRRMRVLREVAVRGSFSAAAEALSFTQSAISQQIAALEREAGTTLVERSARGVRLTDAGRALVEHADVILARLDVALDITVAFRPLPEDGIERLHLLEDPMYVALPQNHPLARKRGLKLEELA